ncbi:hypothetical protein [Streptomyces sp. NPDC059224]|uniref:hypothetical protein n=1 Tax=Streptomyces sp. NPDC059224 TaxID=3346775 RepID=UPI0036CC0167
MLLRVSAHRTDMSVVSMPRDTLVDIPRRADADTGKVYDGLGTVTEFYDLSRELKRSPSGASP